MNRANLPTNANASSCRCGNALPHTHQREYYRPPSRLRETRERFNPGLKVRTNAQLNRAQVSRQNNRRPGARVNAGSDYRDSPLVGGAAQAGAPGGSVRAALSGRAGVPAPGRDPPTVPGPDPLPSGGVNACHFPAPAPRRIYCNPAPFTQIGGQPMQPLVLAYGQSKAVSVL